ncbi:hypothetical protein QWY82_09880 [Simiduia curdlanivorans]|uniref:Uncharacterized protein n=1 Tax=Simiduia curdlanivorans TaxID=1492769 RepID=A0ABV8V9E2_9GAMM|nr:hypothetical protein [Simiduia curdlanivorans]MDN3639117.1 hypothetical protein [Simiduia curdlanivorans]
MSIYLTQDSMLPDQAIYNIRGLLGTTDVSPHTIEYVRGRFVVFRIMKPISSHGSYREAELAAQALDADYLDANYIDA